MRWGIEKDHTSTSFESLYLTFHTTPRSVLGGWSLVAASRRLSREVRIVDYIDEGSRKYVEALQTRAFMLVLPEAIGDLGQNGFVVGLEMIVESRHGGFEGFLAVVSHLQRSYRQVGGAAAGAAAGAGGGIFASKSPAEAAKHIKFFFREGVLDPLPELRCLADDELACTLCVVRPHVIRSGGLGAVFSLITQHGFKVSAARMLHLGSMGAEELLRPYRGVVPYCSEAVEHLKSGPCVALQIEGTEDVVEEFREACGPADPDVARALYPNSLRAILGVQQAAMNAVHCTDLPEDGRLECQYVFGVLARGR